MRKLTDYAIRRIWQLDDDGLTQDEIADYFNISQPSVHKYLKMKPKKEVEKGETNAKSLCSK